MPLGDDHVGEPSQTDLGVIQHLFSSLPHSESTQRSSTSTQSEPAWSSVFCPSFWFLFSWPCCMYSASVSEQEDPRSCPSKFPSWGERRSSRDIDASTMETSKRGVIQMFQILLWLLYMLFLLRFNWRQGNREMVSFLFNARKISQTFFCAPNESSEKIIMYCEFLKIKYSFNLKHAFVCR